MLPSAETNAAIMRKLRFDLATRNYLMIAAFYSEDGSMQRNDITNYVISTLQDPISRVPGVGEIQAFGAQYAMRIWLHPDKLTALDAELFEALLELGN